MSQQHPINLPHNYYDLLGIHKEATNSEIKKAYYSLAVQYHPDKNHQNKEECAKNFHKINQAYKVLSDNDERNLYNFLGAEDYNCLKNQNNVFQNFYDMAFKMKSSFETTENSLFSKVQNLTNINKQRNIDLQKAFKQLFEDDEEEEDSSSDEEDNNDHNTHAYAKNNFAFFNHYSFNYHFNQNGNVFHNNSTMGAAQFTYQSKPSPHFKEDFKTCSQKTYHPNTIIIKKKKKNEVLAEKNKKIIEKLQKKQPIFSILRNQIRKKKKLNDSL